MKVRYLMMAGLLAAGTSCTSAERSVDSVQERKAIDQTRNAYVSAWRAADAAAVTALYTDDALVLYPNQPGVVGSAAIVAYFKGFFSEFVQVDFELISAEIEVAGSWAFDRGAYRWKGMPRTGGDAVDDHGKYLVVLKRQADGSWRIHRDMDNSDRPLSQTARGAG